VQPAAAVAHELQRPGEVDRAGRPARVLEQLVEAAPLAGAQTRQDAVDGGRHGQALAHELEVGSRSQAGGEFGEPVERDPQRPRSPRIRRRRRPRRQQVSAALAAIPQLRDRVLEGLEGRHRRQRLRPLGLVRLLGRSRRPRQQQARLELHDGGGGRQGLGGPVEVAGSERLEARQHLAHDQQQVDLDRRQAMRAQRLGELRQRALEGGQANAERGVVVGRDGAHGDGTGVDGGGSRRAHSAKGSSPSGTRWRVSFTRSSTASSPRNSTWLTLVWRR
jgi:hypothetical protein